MKEKENIFIRFINRFTKRTSDNIEVQKEEIDLQTEVKMKVEANKKQLEEKERKKKEKVLTGIDANDVVSGVYIVKNGITSIGRTMPDELISYGNYRGQLSEIMSLQKSVAISSKNCKINEIRIPSSVREIQEEAFSGYKHLQKVIMSRGVESIGSYAFADCTKLKKIILPEGLKSIGSNAFENCKSLEHVIIPDSVEEIGNDAFRNCTNLKTITYRGKKLYVECVDEEIQMKETELNENNKIHRDEILSEINAEDVVGGVYVVKDEVISIGRTMKDKFYKNGKLSDFIPIYDYTDLDEIKISVAVSCENCEINEIRIPSSVREIQERAFRSYNYKHLQKVIMSRGIESIGPYAFGSCTNLKEIILPEGLKSIGSNAFEDCKSLEHIVIPDSVEVIGDNVFKGCTNLKSITYRGKTLYVECVDGKIKINKAIFNKNNKIRYVFKEEE